MSCKTHLDLKNVKMLELLAGRNLWRIGLSRDLYSPGKRTGVNEVQINYLPSVIALFCQHKLGFPTDPLFSVMPELISLLGMAPGNSCILITSIINSSEIQIDRSSLVQPAQVRKDRLFILALELQKPRDSDNHTGSMKHKLSLLGIK